MNKFQQILTQYWGYTHFRPLQEDIIKSVADEGKDTLGLLPTGGGKSIIFQVPALAKDGICLVITPLIALMKDQVENLKRRGIKAAAIHSGLSNDEISIILDNCAFGPFKFLYLSPERLGTEMFQARVVKMKVNLIAVDEAHCISQWGYDFRPSYLKIAEIRKLLPKVPILALTATATPEVVDDIQEKLQFREKNVFRKSFERKNLTYLVRTVDDKHHYLLKIVSKMANQSGIVYVRSRKATREIAEFLQKNNFSADYYHAGLEQHIKDHKQYQWTSGRCKIIVSTNAFGMGIDKPDVRYVVHFEAPESIEAYFQEAGRAGRDEKRAYAVLLYNQTDKQRLEQSIATNFPEREIIKRIYHALGNYYQIPIGGGKGQVFDFHISDFAQKYQQPVSAIFSCLKLLQSESYIELTDEWENPSRLRFIVSRDDLYKFQVANSKFDTFIKLLLRNLSGVFSDYCKIDEDLLAKKAGTTRDIFVSYLNKLSNMQIINYLPQKRCPLLIYTEERIDERSLLLSRENYDNRKQRYIRRIEAVIQYAESETKCRSQMLLSYFGEKDCMRCGQCDICNRRNELELSKYEFDEILNLIKELLKTNSAPLEQVVDSVPHKEEKAIKVIQWLMENHKISKTDDGKLKWG